MKFSQLKEYNITNIFLEKPYTECGKKARARRFREKLKYSVFLDQQSEML